MRHRLQVWRQLYVVSDPVTLIIGGSTSRADSLHTDPVCLVVWIDSVFICLCRLHICRHLDRGNVRCSRVLVWAQKYKNEIRGPWDVAVPRLN